MTSSKEIREELIKSCTIFFNAPDEVFFGEADDATKDYYVKLSDSIEGLVNLLVATIEKEHSDS